MYLGTYILGEVVPLRVWSRSAADTPVKPDAAPVASVHSSTARVAVEQLPIHDQDDVTGLFQYLLALNSRFAAGRYVVVYNYAISSSARVARDTFSIVAGGNDLGNGVSLHYFQAPQRDVLLMRTTLGSVRRMFNPRL